MDALAKRSFGKGHFMHELPNRALMLAAAWEDLAGKAPGDEGFPEELATAMVVADTLKEMCASRGVPEAAKLLADAEDSLAAFGEVAESTRQAAGKLVAERLGQLIVLAERLSRQAKAREQAMAFAAGEEGEPARRRSDAPAAPEPEPPKKAGPIEPGPGIEGAAHLEKAPIHVERPAVSAGAAKPRPIFILSEDDGFIGELSIQMGHYGYAARSFASLSAFALGLEIERPIAVVADLDLVKGGPGTAPNAGEQMAKALSRLRERAQRDAGAPIPMMVVGSQADFNSRLAAVRAGCAAFFGKPVNVSLLLDKLDAVITNAYVSEPFRILVVDDSETMIRFVSRTLEQAGMSVLAETAPERVLAALSEFNPDLVLMDMHMPGCDGQELSRIIRQYESFTSIPIVFLSSELDARKRMAAMQIGADDFLTKPIEPEHLVGSITTRVQRHRILSSFMVQDSLTGLLNHTKLKQRLDQTIHKAFRSKIPLAFAMVDIDKFKSVNDTYGHPTGDRVIKSLSRLLTRRLRKTDSIGRYGGEEFAIVFWDTDPKSAARILDSIREDFARITHQSESKHFNCSFSAGVAGFPDYPDAQSISSAADKALYAAKRGGRDQVVCASD